MANLAKFIENVQKGVLSDRAPIEEMDDLNEISSFDSLHSIRSRSECTKRGMWAVIDKQWTKKLAKWINGRTCLEVMAGAGWLAKALSYHKVDIIATDDYSWECRQHKAMIVVHPVEKIDGINAAEKYSDRDILIVSWPPHDEASIHHICKEWGNEKPIVFIGEGDGGCCASDKFWEAFKEDDVQPSIEIPRWWGLHDRLIIGKYSNIEAGKVNNSMSQLEVV